MPIFEYQCSRCGSAISVLLLSGEAEPQRCKECGAWGPKRVMSRFSVRGETNDDEALRYRPRDYLEEPSRFERAMKSVQKKTGAKLRGEQVDDAMHRLSKAKLKN